MNKLSEDLKQCHDSGDFGLGLEGFHERAKEIEDLLGACIADLYSPGGKFKKATALKLVKYVNENEIAV